MNTYNGLCFVCISSRVLQLMDWVLTMDFVFSGRVAMGGGGTSSPSSGGVGGCGGVTLVTDCGCINKTIKLYPVLKFTKFWIKLEQTV